MESLELMQSDLLFDLGYVLLWVALFAVTKKGLSRRIVVGLFHVLTICIALITISAYRYFEVPARHSTPTLSSTISLLPRERVAS